MYHHRFRPGRTYGGDLCGRACLSVLVLEKEFVSGGQVVNTYEVDNYPGYRGISGFDLG